MSAEILRRAAALMREQAGQACASPWRVDPNANARILGNGTKVADVGVNQGHRSAEHIASWHPAVALAVADWLDAAGADLWAHGLPDCCTDGCMTCDDDPWAPHIRRALAVATSYLGES